MKNLIQSISILICTVFVVSCAEFHDNVLNASRQGLEGLRAVNDALDKSPGKTTTAGQKRTSTNESSVDKNAQYKMIVDDFRGDEYCVRPTDRALGDTQAEKYSPRTSTKFPVPCRKLSVGQIEAQAYAKQLFK